MTQTASSSGKQQGFTLLEVMIAITLTALVLGNLFALQSQSKRLSFKAQMNLHKNINQRAYFNAAWINNRRLDSYMDELSRHSDYSVANESELKIPQEQVKPLNFSLESFTIMNHENETVLSSVRFKQSTVSRRMR
ncbi:MAG: prepilin-type N-terminal cleavage/methylation domain-containing protein [gamma proteobacterium symbiont of Bathyaustriella thionipta]|nr:prepilin-type N-terminal cleavage/methylation domain-containing protein [gamma proteobacterium symbiont of Bathyaustriella thionipta]MCU7951313.1 prepilin-type N-terminal cleavage/methylation domain-containing protein [gamma proteobacterium symbiont of Bathyaustriella thionipta]MCU7952188.1 prepilin-type N-terminal cleavage/methylation domain-containing protein [gamma proteobacterium symbiont of Bathyaustriella thionipta]MCU7957868.1 prepilin-type N-terminal cleavage/methylation domain-contai